MRLADIVVADTNVLISSVLARRGNEAQVWDMIRRELITPAVSPDVLAEYYAVLQRKKFRFSQRQIDDALFPFLHYGFLVEPTTSLSISPHEPDNRLLECAEAANAGFLITGNLRHFPQMHGRTRIVNARTFLDLYAPLNP